MRPVSARARGEYNAVFALEHYFPKSASLKRLRASLRDEITSQVREAGPGRVLPVARRRELSPEEFQREHLARGVPVLIEGGARGRGR